MPRMSEYDRQAITDLQHRQHDVIARAQALERGFSREQVRYRLRDGGPWQRFLPGVYLTHTGLPSADQRDMGALLYAGPRAVLTGFASLRRSGLVLPQTDAVDVLVPVDVQKRDVRFVRVHRTARLPRGFCVTGEIRYALPPRAVADASRWLTDLGEVREVVAGAVQHGLCPIELLAEELGQGPRQGSALLRRALAEVADGVRSAAEGQLHALIKRARLPMPLFNPRLFTGQAFLAVPDCWWPEAGVAVEVDSRAWHFSPRSWENTLARHARMAAVGIIVLHFAPRQIYTQPAAVVSRIQSALASARDRSLPQVRTLPAR
jgi:very-short-patch-repair endonuclease